MSDGPAQRADARRNRQRVLDAAEAVVAAHGASVSTEEVARQAGVGIGTVFRHFPTKEALLTAVYVARLERMADQARACASADDPGEAFFAFVTHVVAQSASKHAIVDALGQAGIQVDIRGSRASQELQAAVQELLVRAQRAGTVRPDLGVAELIAVLVGASRTVEFAGPEPDVQARALAVTLDGLRPATRAPGPAA